MALRGLKSDPYPGRFKEDGFPSCEPPCKPFSYARDMEARNFVAQQLYKDFHHPMPAVGAVVRDMGARNKVALELAKPVNLPKPAGVYYRDMGARDRVAFELAKPGPERPKPLVGIAAGRGTRNKVASVLAQDKHLPKPRVNIGVRDMLPRDRAAMIMNRNKRPKVAGTYARPYGLIRNTAMAVINKNGYLEYVPDALDHSLEMPGYDTLSALHDGIDETLLPAYDTLSSRPKLDESILPMYDELSTLHNDVIDETILPMYDDLSTLHDNVDETLLPMYDALSWRANNGAISQVEDHLKEYYGLGPEYSGTYENEGNTYSSTYTAEEDYDYKELYDYDDILVTAEEECKDCIGGMTQAEFAVMMCVTLLLVFVALLVGLMVYYARNASKARRDRSEMEERTVLVANYGAI